jgi:UDP-N-acetylglucosamine 4-epimerase
MLVAAKEAEIERFVYAASSSTYGDSTALPKVESKIGVPLSPYAVTKYANELYAHVFALNYNMQIIGLRYFNVFGPNQDPFGAYAAVIPLFMKAIIENTPPTINGDGSQSRDFTYVDNAVQANVKAFYAPLNGGHEVVNVAFGERTDLKQLWSYIQQIAGKNLEPNFGPPRVGDIQNSLADLTKAKEILDYNPQVSVREGLRSAYQYFKEIFNAN